VIRPPRRWRGAGAHGRAPWLILTKMPKVRLNMGRFLKINREWSL
jgi:hypothetical protein